jgi:hypothetical protein
MVERWNGSTRKAIAASLGTSEEEIKKAEDRLEEKIRSMGIDRVKDLLT